MFDDLLKANATYRSVFEHTDLDGKAARQLAVLTCIDSRIDPLAMLGLKPGDAKILRNAGARVTSDALRSLILATNLLDVTRICIVQHTDCAVGSCSESALRADLENAAGCPVDIELFASVDRVVALREDVEAIRGCQLISESVEVGTFVFDVDTGELVPIPTALA
ncbi:MAG: carbonic anhydrase [Candidatus Poriferisodalaceae bacterium]|jgi:carbonic anhydrase